MVTSAKSKAFFTSLTHTMSSIPLVLIAPVLQPSQTLLLKSYVSIAGVNHLNHLFPHLVLKKLHLLTSVKSTISNPTIIKLSFYEKIIMISLHFALNYRVSVAPIIFRF
jgi:hypothetical protein